jgi:hypothetical protein
MRDQRAARRTLDGSQERGESRHASLEPRIGPAGKGVDLTRDDHLRRYGRSPGGPAHHRRRSTQGCGMEMADARSNCVIMLQNTAIRFCARPVLDARECTIADPGATEFRLPIGTSTRIQPQEGPTCSRASICAMWRRAPPRSGCESAARGRRSCFCTAIRRPMLCGTGSPRRWPSAAPWCAPICAATATAASQPRTRSTRPIASAPRPRT